MISTSVQIDPAALASLNAVLERVKVETPKRLSTEIRRAALYLCKGLKKRTIKAPKRIQAGEYAATPSPFKPRYIHSSSRANALLRRWQLIRHLGTPDAYAKQYFVSTKAHRNNRGRMVGKNEAAEKRELLRYHGSIARQGLAKASWGWVAQKIYAAGAQDLAFKLGKVRRDPRKAVNGNFQKLQNGANAHLENALDYILNALPPPALSAAVAATAKRLEYNIQNHIERTIK